MTDLRYNRSSTNKQEEEVDHLTDLLVKSMESSVEPDFFGKLFYFVSVKINSHYLLKNIL